MQPFDYTISAVNPTQAFMQSFQAGNVIAQAQAARQQQEAQKQQAMRLQNALSGLGPNATPADFMGLVQQFPDLAEPLTKQYRTFDDVRKNGLFSAGERAFMLLRPGADGAINVDNAVASLEESAAAFENSGQPDIAKQLRDSAKAARINPGAARTALGTMLAFADPDKFKKIGDAIGQGELTAFQKNLAAANIDPASEEGKRLARQYVQNQVDPIVTMETPPDPVTGLTKQFIGPMSLYVERYGQAPQGAQRLPQPKSKAEFDALPSGAEFVAPDGSVRRKPGVSYGKRADGTEKGAGFLGELRRPDGQISTELSVGVNINGKEVEIPTLVPTLTPAERDFLLRFDGPASDIPDAIIRKAVEHAKRRIANGQSPFAFSGERKP